VVPSHQVQARHEGVDVAVPDLSILIGYTCLILTHYLNKPFPYH
jgi:hypothetical protein